MDKKSISQGGRRKPRKPKVVVKPVSVRRTLDSLLGPQITAEPIDSGTLLGQLSVQRGLNRSLDTQLTLLLSKLEPFARGGSEAIANTAADLIEDADTEAENPSDADRAVDDLPVILHQQDSWPAHAAAHNDQNVALRNLIARVVAFNALM